jgi:hypothetical protein
MITQTMVQPSFWIEDNIQINQVLGVNLFKFTDNLQVRLEILIDRQKAGVLSAEETTELAGITELDRIFTLINARIIAWIGRSLDLATSYLSYAVWVEYRSNPNFADLP